MGAKVTAIEYVFPDQVITNIDLQKEFPDYDFKKFEDKVGIDVRYVVKHGESALDLAVKACEKLFKRFSRDSIDYVLYCTQSPEYFLPTSACILQDLLKLKNSIGALDFNLGCSGFTYGLSLAKALINSGQASSVLLVTAETYSKFIHPEDRSNRAIFGDAATATLISHDANEKMAQFLFGTDGSGFDKLIVKNGAGRFPFNENAETVEYGSGNKYTDNDLYMNGPEVFNFTNEVIPPFVNEILQKNKISIEEIDQFIFHQANAFMLNFMRKRLKIQKDKFYINLANGGNTVSNTIPIALKRYMSGQGEGDQKIIVTGFGVGLSWSGGLIEINNKI